MYSLDFLCYFKLKDILSPFVYSVNFFSIKKTNITKIKLAVVVNDMLRSRFYNTNETELQ